MPHRPIALVLLSALVFTSPGSAQDTISDALSDPTVNLSRPADRARVVARIAEIQNNRRQTARARATLTGLPLRTILPNGRVQEIADFRADGRPLYRTTHNANAAISTGANLLRTSPYSLSGSGVTIGIWDGGSARSTHQEFNGRVTVMDGSAAGDHATHVGGTMIAAGINTSARGMANSAILNSYDWNSDTSEMTSRAATYAGEPGAIYLSNHSYSYITGWNYTGNPSRLWEWWGNGTTANATEQDFGRYNSYTANQDALAYNAPYYLIFRSAGNERSDNPSLGDNVGLSSSGGITVSYDPAIHPAGDGNYRGGYENIGFEALAKNVMTVGAANDAVTSGLRDVSKATISSFSSWGPTDDGRIKPDVVANGASLYSSLASSNSSYGTYSGTSMSTPNACGSASLLIEQFGSLFPGQAMRASTLKGLLIHTADDRGNAGPDYQYGWGLVNAKAAADIILDHYDFPEKQSINENQLTTSVTSQSHAFLWDGATPISATLCWTDPAGSSTSTSDLRAARLVNNLNLKIIAPNGSEFFPFVMPFVGNWTQASMSLPATTGINNTDNIEQIRIASPSAAGTWQAVVSFSGSITGGSQTYSLILSGAAAVEPPPLPLALSSVSPDSGYAGPVTLDLTGTSLRADTTVTLTKAGQIDITATSVQLIGSTLRCQFDLTSALTGLWSITATNPNLETSSLTDAFTVIGAIWSEAFDGVVSGWTSSATTGANSWSLTTAKSHSPATSYFAPAVSSKSTTNLTSPSISIPAGATGMQLKFWHDYDLQNTRDVGKLEFSLDGGTWFDAAENDSGAAFASNGYNTTSRTNGRPSDRNEFSGDQVWSGNSNGFIETIVNLTDDAKYAGHNLRMRWRLATDGSNSSPGWHVDSIVLLGDADVANLPPQIIVAASTSSAESETDPDTTVYQVIRGAETELSVIATDDGGESSLNYTWSVTSGPTTPVIFTENGSNTAKNTTAIFQTPGDYQLSLSVADANSLAVISAVNVRVYQTADSIVVSPFSATVQFETSRQFNASLLDQFGTPMTNQPASFTWSVSGGGGTISSDGLFSATAAGGPFVISAESGAFFNTASITVTPAPAIVLLTNLNQTYDGNPKSVTVSTSPSSLTHAVTYDTLPDEPVNAGTYAVEANITDSNYQGTASDSLVIAKATATVALSDLVQTYDGNPKHATVTTNPPDLTVSTTYEGSSTPPTAAGTYAVIATIDDPNYEGSASGSLIIEPGNDLVSWKNENFTPAEQSAGLADNPADPDSDGLQNLAEFALGTNPREYTPPLNPTLDENGLTLTFSRPANLPGVSYSAESAEEFGSWLPIPIEVITPGDPETVRARDPLTTGDPSKRFLRLRFEHQ